MKYLLLPLIVLLFVIASCDGGSTKITDYYDVYEYTLMCKLGCKNDPYIENVNHVEWDDSTIIASTKKGFYIIEGNSYGLCCCCGNETKGPLKEQEIKEYKLKKAFKARNSKRI